LADVALQNVSKTYPGNVKAVNDVTLHVPNGQFAVLLGPSGCGKTTALRLIAGLERADKGEIIIGGKVVNSVPPQRRNVAVVFQSYALYPHMTVAQNMGFGLKMRGMPSADIRKQVVETSRLLGLESLLDRYPGQLSGGQRQRVALGRAIVRHPAVFLLDEPLSNLDAQLRADMRVELSNLQRRLGATFVFVTHDQIEAMTLADVMAVMRDGVLQQNGSPLEIYEKPANIFVAGFIGSPKMNLIPCTVVRQDREIILNTDAFALSIPNHLPGLEAGMHNGNIILGFRPEHCRVCSSAESGPAIDMTVDLIEMLGGQKFVYGTAGSQRLTVCVDPRDKPEIGERLKLLFDLEQLHFFDQQTGNRLESVLR
jgi:multiple sugar transport system ATP-binding protein